MGQETQPQNIFAAKNLVQRKIMERITAGRGNTTEKRNAIIEDEWTEKGYSDRFREFFDKKLEEDPDFLRRCAKEPEAVADDFLKSDSRPPMAA